MKISYVVVNSSGLIIGTYSNFRTAQLVAAKNRGTRAMTMETYQQLTGYEERPIPRPPKTIKKSIIPNMIGSYESFETPIFSPPTTRSTLSQRNLRRSGQYQEYE